MPIIATPVLVEAGGGSVTVCDDLLVRRIEESMFDGCPVLTKMRVILVEKGVAATLEWQMRGRDGMGVDLTDCISCTVSSLSSSSLEADGSVVLRLGTCEGRALIEIEGTFHDLNDGLVRAEIPQAIADGAGIYTLAWGIYDCDKRLVFTNSGLLSVERGLFGNTDQVTGPPSMMDIRLQMRDTDIENDLLQSVEFSDAEILHAIVRPVMQWNESPPPVAVFNCATFPYRYNWMNAITANLLETASHYYRRNKLTATHGGMTWSEKDKDNPYLQTAMILKREWMDFILTKKAEINAGLAYGSVGSPYGGGYY